MTALTMRAKIGFRWRVEFVIEPDRPLKGEVIELDMRWSPKPPHRLSMRELADYRTARKRFIAELARLRGGRIAVVEPELRRAEIIEPAADGKAA